MVEDETKTSLTTATAKRQSDQQRQSHLAAELCALHQLLEEYAPTWYTAELHHKAEAALRDETNASPATFIELWELLEIYAPRWYTEAEQSRATALRKMFR